MLYRSAFLLCTVLALLISCQSNEKQDVEPGLQGLWLVQSVKSGEEEMTPNARWVRFHADSTQESGNGWTQHSVGTWLLDESNQLLTIVNTNGLTDNNPPFSLRLQGDTMYWTRNEGGQQISIELTRIEKFPAAYGDQLLGLWKLKKKTGRYPYFNDLNGDQLYFGWDKRFQVRSDSVGLRGIYAVHGHRPELGLIPFNEQYDRANWSFNCESTRLTLKLLGTDSLVTRSFERVIEFPQ